jgi:hypothetical protein
MANDFLDYEVLVDDALRHVVREALSRVAKDGMPDGHHFYITFRCDHPGTEMADALRDQFENEMTIVLQHQFSSLRTEDHRFRVTLSFSGVPRTLVVPYAAVSSFADPDVKFALQFRTDSSDTSAGDPSISDELPEPPEPDSDTDADAANSGDKVVALDRFRKK